jgi:hypothetical protein
MPAEATPLRIEIPEADAASVTASGGHFAAFEQPDLFVNEISSFFRLIR